MDAPQARRMRTPAEPAVEIETKDGEVITAPIKEIMVEERRPRQSVKILESSDSQDAGSIEVKPKEHPPKKPATRPAPAPVTPEPPAPPQHEADASETPDYNNPWEGMLCPVFGKCTEVQMQKCFNEAGHCLVLDDEMDAEEAD